MNQGIAAGWAKIESFHNNFSTKKVIGRADSYVDQDRASGAKLKGVALLQGDASGVRADMLGTLRINRDPHIPHPASLVNRPLR